VTAERRSANFFRGTSRDPHIAYDALEAQALNIVRESIIAHALSVRRNLSPADLDRMLSAAQSQLRGMAPEDLRGISPSSAILKTITDASLAAAPVGDPRTQATLLAASANDPATGTESGSAISARMLRLDMERAERASSSRFDGLGGERLTQGDLQNIAAARSLARDLGMPWAANNPDLLRLGPSAIRTLHEAGVQRQTFERMTSERVGIRAETAVGMAAWAKRQNLTPEQTNRIMNSTSDLHERLSAGRPADERQRVQQDLDESLKRFTERPNTAASRQTLEDERMRHARNEQEREQIRQHSRVLAEAEKANVAAANADAVSTRRRDEAVQRNQSDVVAGLEGFDAPSTGTPRSTATPAPAGSPAATPPTGTVKPNSAPTAAPAQTVQQSPPRPRSP